MKKSRLALGIGVLLMTTYASSFIAQPPHRSVKGKPAEVRELYKQNAMLQRAWYLQKDERAFWKFISRHGRLNRNTDMDIFFAAFTKPLEQVDIGTRKTEVDSLSHLWRDHREDLLNEGNRSFAILGINVLTYGQRQGMSTSDPQFIAYAASLQDIEYLLVTYIIYGNGYAHMEVLLVWVRERNTWKVWDIQMMVP